MESAETLGFLAAFLEGFSEPPSLKGGSDDIGLRELAKIAERQRTI